MQENEENSAKCSNFKDNISTFFRRPKSHQNAILKTNIKEKTSLIKTVPRKTWYALSDTANYGGTIDYAAYIYLVTLLNCDPFLKDHPCNQEINTIVAYLSIGLGWSDFFLKSLRHSSLPKKTCHKIETIFNGVQDIISKNGFLIHLALAIHTQIERNFGESQYTDEIFFGEVALTGFLSILSHDPLRDLIRRKIFQGNDERGLAAKITDALLGGIAGFSLGRGFTVTLETLIDQVIRSEILSSSAGAYTRYIFGGIIGSIGAFYSWQYLYTADEEEKSSFEKWHTWSMNFISTICFIPFIFSIINSQSDKNEIIQWGLYINLFLWNLNLSLYELYKDRKSNTERQEQQNPVSSLIIEEVNDDEPNLAEVEEEVKLLASPRM